MPLFSRTEQDPILGLKTMSGADQKTSQYGTLSNGDKKFDDKDWNFNCSKNVYSFPYSGHHYFN